jgi:glutamate--cysteine ligase
VASFTADPRPLTSLEDAEAYVALVCFKHGPPSRVGVEHEWTVHHRDAPGRPLDPALLAAALGRHAPASLQPEAAPTPLPGSSLLTVEPGGQIEISSPPAAGVAPLVDLVDRDVAAVDALLHRAGLARGDAAVDAHRSPRRVLAVPRYAAMQDLFDRRGAWGRTMMCSTASTQVCLDAGEEPDIRLRWHALHAIGPALVALFANSRRAGGRDTGWASHRLRATFGTWPPSSLPVAAGPSVDPVAAWVERAMTSPLVCVRRTTGDWRADPAMTFRDWVRATNRPPPTYDDLDYHLSTIFPPVRPRGYVEVRYIDTQPDEHRHHPLVLLSTLLKTRALAEAAVEAVAATSGRWLTAARDGLADRSLRESARALVELAADHLDPLLPRALTAPMLTALDRRTDPRADHRTDRHPDHRHVDHAADRFAGPGSDGHLAHAPQTRRLPA